MLLFQKFKNRHRERSVAIHKLNDGLLRRLTPRNDVKAFTLVEIMIVVAIIALLASIAIPNLQRANEQAKYAKFKKFASSLADAAEQYQADTGVYPSNVTSLTGATPPYFSSTTIDEYCDNFVSGLPVDLNGDTIRVSCRINAANGYGGASYSIIVTNSDLSKVFTIQGGKQILTDTLK